METRQITRTQLNRLLDNEFGWANVRPINTADAELWLDYFYGICPPVLVND